MSSVQNTGSIGQQIGTAALSSRCGQGSAGVDGIKQIANAASAFHRSPKILTRQSIDRFGLSGVTRDGNGAALAGVTVDLFASGSNIWLARTVSDGSGNYAFTGVGFGTVFIIAYLAGSPEVAGSSVHNLAPTGI